MPALPLPAQHQPAEGGFAFSREQHGETVRNPGFSGGVERSVRLVYPGEEGKAPAQQDNSSRSERDGGEFLVNGERNLEEKVDFAPWLEEVGDEGSRFTPSSGAQPRGIGKLSNRAKCLPRSGEGRIFFVRNSLKV